MRISFQFPDVCHLVILTQNQPVLLPAENIPATLTDFLSASVGRLTGSGEIPDFSRPSSHFENNASTFAHFKHPKTGLTRGWRGKPVTNVVSKMTKFLNDGQNVFYLLSGFVLFAILFILHRLLFCFGFRFIFVPFRQFCDRKHRKILKIQSHMFFGMHCYDCIAPNADINLWTIL